MFCLLKIEFKNKLFSLLSVITFLLVLAMYLTQCLPSKWYYYLKPMNEKNYIYLTLKRDYITGKTEEVTLEKNIVLCSEKQLTEEQREKLKKSILKMNPTYLEEEMIREINFSISEEEYKKIMIELDLALGGNSYYGERLRSLYYRDYKNKAFLIEDTNKFIEKKSLEQVQKTFQEEIQKESFSDIYARNYADYMGILAGILPAIFGAFILIEDRKYKMHEFIYSKSIPSWKIVYSKYITIISIFAIFFYIIAGISTVFFLKFKEYYSINYIAFFQYTSFWVMPTVFFTTALAMLLSLLFLNGIIPLFIQIIIFFLSSLSLIGEYKIYRPIIRFNEIGLYDFYNANKTHIFINRIFIFSLSFILLSFTVFLYSNIRNTGKNSIFIKNKEKK